MTRSIICFLPVLRLYAVQLIACPAQLALVQAHRYRISYNLDVQVEVPIAVVQLYRCVIASVSVK